MLLHRPRVWFGVESTAVAAFLLAQNQANGREALTGATALTSKTDIMVLPDHEALPPPHSNRPVTFTPLPATSVRKRDS